MQRFLARTMPVLGIAMLTAFASAPALAQQASIAVPDPDLGARNTALVVGEVLAVAWYGKQNWWQEGFRSDFQRANEGWFGQNTYAGGADKLGHFYTNYVGGRLLTKAFRATGNDPDRALFLGTSLALGTMMAVEVADGYAKGWRFSKEDAIMNLAGTGAAILFEKNSGLDELVDLRFQYHRSGVGDRKFDPLGDYSGQTYVLALKASGVPGLRDVPVLRYLELAAGYGVRNYAPNRPEANAQRYRQAYVGVALNLSELLRGADPGRRLPGRGALDTAFEYLELPGTAAFKRHRLPTD